MSQFNFRKWIKPGLYTTLDKFSVVLLGFINFFILSRVLSKNDFGVWVLFTGLVSVLETMREGFIKQPFIALMPTMQGVERNEVGSTAMVLNGTYSGLVSVFLFFGGFYLENFWNAQPLANLLKIYSIINLVFIPFSHFEYLKQMELDFRGIFLSHLSRSLVPTIFILTTVSLKQPISLSVLALSVLAGNVIGLVVMVYFGWSSRHNFVSISWKWIKTMVGFGRFSLGTNMASLSIRNMDSWMLGKMLSPESVASYNPAIRVANLVEIPTLTIANLVFPKMAQHARAQDQISTNELYSRSVGLLLAFMIPLSIVMFLFSDQIVYLIAGKNYSDSGYLLKVTAFYTLFIPFGRQFGILLDATRRPHVNFYVVLATALAGSIITWWFIGQWGVVGAAYGTLITYLLRFGFQQWWLYANFKISTVHVFKAVPGLYSDLLKFILNYGTRGKLK